MDGLKRHFNSTTTNGRANVAKATYASFALLYLYYRFKKKKTPPPPPKTPMPPTEKDSCKCKDPCYENKSAGVCPPSYERNEPPILPRKDGSCNMQFVKEEGKESQLEERTEDRIAETKQELTEEQNQARNHPFMPGIDVDDCW